MQPIETKRTAQEIRRAFTGASNSRKFHHLFRNNVQFVAGSDNLTGNAIMTASLAKRAGCPAIICP